MFSSIFSIFTPFFHLLPSFSSPFSHFFFFPSSFFHIFSSRPFFPYFTPPPGDILKNIYPCWYLKKFVAFRGSTLSGRGSGYTICIEFRLSSGCRSWMGEIWPFVSVFPPLKTNLPRQYMKHSGDWKRPDIRSIPNILIITIFFHSLYDILLKWLNFYAFSCHYCVKLTARPTVFFIHKLQQS